MPAINQTDAEGRPAGPWEEYHATGAVAGRGDYVDGEQHGPWKRWYDTGSLIAEGEWRLGTKVGEWKYYDKDGSVRRTVVHRG